MNCFDCTTVGNTQAAVAICHDCGAGICADHAVTQAKRLTRMGGLGMAIPVEPPARTFRCRTCDDARNAPRNTGARRRSASSVA